MRKTPLALSVPFLLCVLAHAASFDCTKAKTAQEKAICASPQLSKADDQMAAAYHAWLAAAQPAWTAGIRENQIVWLRERDTSCPASESAGDLQSCLDDIYKARIEDLEQMVQHFGGMTFVSQTITLTAPDGPGNEDIRTFEETPGFGTLEASWPQASSTTPQWTAWNNALVPAAILAANEDEETSAQDWKGLVKPTVDRGLTVTVERLTTQWVSATIVDFYDGHGAHPTQNTWQFYWLLNQQRALKPEDVFLPNSGWDTWMEKRLDSYLHQALDAQSSGNYQSWFAPDDAQKTLEAIVTNPQDWKLEPAGLSLFFQPYQVACYACTPDPLTISWSDLKPYLQPGFVLPQ